MFHKGLGKTVVYVGDGAGDLNAAMRADVVFVIDDSPLDRLCAERKVPCRRVRTFRPVQAFVRSHSALSMVSIGRRD